MMRRLVCVWFLCLIGVMATAQPFSPDLEALEPIEYGKVGPHWLAMNTYESDSTADAVILADIGEARLQWSGNKQVVIYTYHRRIKILTEEGLNQVADFDLSYDAAQKNLTHIEAASYRLNPEGEVVQFKVDRPDLRDETITRRRRRVSFRFPLLKVGSVVEYTYTYYSEQLNLLEPWIFQRPFPVVHSEFHLTVPDTHRYQRVMQGDLRNVVMLEEPIQYQSQADRLGFQRNLSMGASINQPVNFPRTGTHQTYILRKIPALSQDEFSPRDESLLPGIRFQLTGVSDGNNVQGVFRNWKQLARYATRQVKKHKLRGRRGYLEQTARRLAREQPGKISTAQAIFSWVQNTFAWDSTYDWRPQRLDRVIEAKRGNSGSLNLIAILMMREVGLEVQPVLLSTRSHGPVQVVAANLGQFNHLIGGMRINGTERLFDVLSDFDELGILPREDLNQAGFWLKDQGGEWIRLQSHNQIVRFTYSRFTLNDKGLLTGDISVTNKSYSAALERERAAELAQDPQGYLRRVLLTGMGKPEVMDYEVENLDVSGEPLTVSCTLQTRDFVEQIGNLLIIEPMMTKQVAENPFSQEERAMPVDLTYPLRESHLLGLRIPDNYEVVQMPQPLRVMLPNDAGLFVYNVMQMDQILHVSSCIFLNQTVFLPSEYQGIRTFFDYIVRKHTEDIVLKRRESSE